MAGRTVSGGATDTVSSGVTDTGDLVTDPGSLLIIEAGGMAIRTTIANSGMLSVSSGGAIGGTTFVSGGTLTLSSGAQATAGALVEIALRRDCFRNFEQSLE